MIRPLIESLPASRIREVANAGIGRADVLKFWFGEGDQVTPAFIREAAKAALDGGQTSTTTTSGSRNCALPWRRMPTGCVRRDIP